MYKQKVNKRYAKRSHYLARCTCGVNSWSSARAGSWPGSWPGAGSWSGSESWPVSCSGVGSGQVSLRQ